MRQGDAALKQIWQQPNVPVIIRRNKKGQLHRLIAAASAATKVTMVSKAVVSKTYGKRSVKEYVDDDDFWSEQTDSEALKKWAREPAMYLVALRNKAK